MIHIDHISVGAKNLYEATFRLSEETGFGNYDGGFFPGFGIANKIVPLGGDTYIEVEGIVDPYIISQGQPMVTWFYNSVVNGDAFMGLALRADTLDELQQFAEYHKTKVRGIENGRIAKTDGGRQRLNGTTVSVAQAPYVGDSWTKGYPNMYLQEMASHPSRAPVEAGTGRGVTPKGIAWLELGGTKAEMQKWLSPRIPLGSFPFRFNGNAPGLYAIGVNSDRGEVEIRRHLPILNT